MAQAYTLFVNGGSVQPLKAMTHLTLGDTTVKPAASRRRAVARPETTFLVTNMMRSVINEGTGAGARAAGFTPDAAGKSGTTNDLRDAWFVGFTPELLTVVWVGFDNNEPVSLTGTQAALPIWTEFMRAYIEKRGDRKAPPQFEAPGNIVLVTLDSGVTEAFINGTQPQAAVPAEPAVTPVSTPPE